MKKITMYSLIISCLVGYSFALTSLKEGMLHDEGWQVWKASHNKKYTHIEEEQVRYGVWKDNFRRIVEHNERSKDLFLAMNHFGDLTNTEFSARMNGYTSSKKTNQGSTFVSPNYLKVPDAVDWRTKGMVTPIKNQEQCGSCWAFSATGSLEGQHQKKSGKLVSLSEQNLVDCSQKFGNQGCNGGLMDSAFQYIKANGGIDTEKSYSYEGEDDKCRYKKDDVGATVTGFVDIKSGSEDALQNATASVGPISVAIDANHFSFQFYHRGVYDSWLCSSTNLDHGVLVVGYDTTPEGVKYWIVKNSWGTGWGQKGYIWMSRDKDNQCGIATQASYPLV